ncbi:transketolase [Candidatus Saccharibacteria bacterium RIFCSPHIGHO2_12_FULL_47_16b]|nr:MAG: transketolase [Candidatus Saccharibacteria bacterium RIFCSPHIGHO2_12_FULL_47_16b]
MVQREYSTAELQKIAELMREDIIKMLERAGSGHSAGPLGLADIFTALYFSVLTHDPKNPDWPHRDILILSNGHCVPVRYAAMARAGYFPLEELQTLRKFGSRLQGHPERLRLPGMETTSGPLGCGLSQASGMALALKMDKISHRFVYVVMSDGEQDEGNTWEAAMLAAKYKLSNLIAITDRNNIQIDGPTETVMPLENLKRKWEAFGWYIIEIDGNDIEAVINACQMAKAVANQPVMILAHTIPGKGIDFMEYDFHWHGEPPSHAEAKMAIHELRTLGGKIKGEHQ